MFIKDGAKHTIQVGDESEKNIFDPATFSDYKKTLAFLLDNKRVMIKRPGGKHEVISFEKVVPDPKRPGHTKIISESGEVIDDSLVEYHSPLYHVKNILPRLNPKFQDAFRDTVGKIIDQWNNVYDQLKAHHLPVCMPDPDYFMEYYAQNLRGNSFDNGMIAYANSFLGAMQSSIAINEQTYSRIKGRGM